MGVSLTERQDLKQKVGRRPGAVGGLLVQSLGVGRLVLDGQGIDCGSCLLRARQLAIHLGMQSSAASQVNC